MFFAASGPKEAILTREEAVRDLVGAQTRSAAVVVIVGASFITGLLGDSYSEAAEVLRWIAFHAALERLAAVRRQRVERDRPPQNPSVSHESSAGINIVLNII